MPLTLIVFEYDAIDWYPEPLDKGNRLHMIHFNITNDRFRNGSCSQEVNFITTAMAGKEQILWSFGFAISALVKAGGIDCKSLFTLNVVDDVDDVCMKLVKGENHNEEMWT